MAEQRSKPRVSNTNFQYLFSGDSTVSADLIHDCIRAAFATSIIARAEVLSGGLINTNVKVEFSSNEPPVILRFYREDAAVCLKETALLRLLRSTVPVPAIRKPATTTRRFVSAKAARLHLVMVRSLARA